MKRKRILVVDDDRTILQLYRTALVIDGFQVETADDGISALRRIDEQCPDLVVLDLQLPNLDGVSVLSELRAHSDTWGVPVVVVTGTDYSRAVAQASSILRKPCEPDRLISVIEEHLVPSAA